MKSHERNILIAAWATFIMRKGDLISGLFMICAGIYIIADPLQEIWREWKECR